MAAVARFLVCAGSREAAVDVVRHTIRRECEVVIIVSHDSDLLPAVEAVVELGTAHVEVATWSTLRQPIRMPGPRPGSWVPWCHWLSADDFTAVRDWTDYAAGC